MSVLFRRTETNNGFKKTRKKDSKPPQAKRRDEELFVFGYACKLFEDNEKANFMDQEKHLIQWPGDSSLLIDRYDGRLLFTEQSQFEPSGGVLLPEDEEMERVCDEERYLELKTDLMEEDINQEEEMKRFREALAGDGAYNAVGFGYGDGQPVEGPLQGPPMLAEESHEPVQGPALKPQVTLEKFIAPEELEVPSDMEIPQISKMNAIIERTAVFVSKQGTQMEILVKAKQAGNPQFDFLNYGNWLNPYYKHMLKYIKEGKYEPVIESQPSPEPEEEESEEDSDDEYELHPLLTASLKNTSSPRSSAPSSPVPYLGDKFHKTFAPEGANIAGPYNRDSNESPSYGVPYTDGVPSPYSDGHPGMWAQEPRGYQYDVPTSGYGGHVMMAPYGAVSMPYMHHPVQAAPVLSVADMIPPPPPPPGEGPPEEEWLSEQVHSPASSAPLPPPPPLPILPTFIAAHNVPIAGHPGIPVPHPAPSIIPPPPDLQPIVDKLARYVAKNGTDFEAIIKAKNDPRFDFVYPWNEHHSYYQIKKQMFAEEQEHNRDENQEPPTVPSSSKGNSGPISFSIKSKDVPKPKIEYRSNVIYKQSFEPGESEEDEETNEQKEQEEEEDEGSANDDKDNEESLVVKDDEESTNDGGSDLSEQMDVIAAAQREAQRLEVEAQVQSDKQLKLERRRKASLFISMLKKKSGSENDVQEHGEDTDSDSTRRKFTERKREHSDSGSDDTELEKRGRYEEDGEATASGVGAPSPDIIRATQDLMAKVKAASRNKR